MKTAKSLIIISCPVCNREVNSKGYGNHRLKHTREREAQKQGNIMRECKTCGIVKPIERFYKNKTETLGYSYKCKTCRNGFEKNNKTDKYRAIRNRAHKMWLKRNPEKHKAQLLLRVAIKKGKIIRKNCEKCGKQSHAHHDDYAKPLDVLWLCATHHSERHKYLNEQ